MVVVLIGTAHLLMESKSVHFFPILKYEPNGIVVYALGIGGLGDNVGLVVLGFR